MQKNILIIGAPRCGKTAVINKILKEYPNYEPIRMDVYTISHNVLLQMRERKKNANKDYEVIDMGKIAVKDEELGDYIYQIYKQTSMDIENTDRSVIIEAGFLPIKDAVEIFQDEFDIYCVGMDTISADELHETILDLNIENDWVLQNGYVFRQMICENIVGMSKKVKEECSIYDLPYYEMSGNRKEKIENLFKDIESNSILT